MKLPHYLRSHRRDDDEPYVIGGAAGVLAFLIVSFFAFAAVDGYLLRSGSLAAVISSVLVDLANGDRSANAVGGLTPSPVLVRVAQAKANDMAAKSYFAHTSPEGKDPWYWFKQEGYAFIYAGENLAVDFSDSAMVESAWMNSPEHRANLLDGRYTEIGIATAQGTFEGHPTTFVVQVFGTPAPAPVAVAVTQASVPVAPTELATATAPPPPPRPVVAGTTTPPEETVVTPAPAEPVEPSLPEATAPEQAPVALATAPPPTVSPWWASLLASPRTVLGYVYYALAALTLLILAYVTELEFHRRHLRHVVAASALFALMASLFLIADLLLFARPVLAAL